MAYSVDRNRKFSERIFSIFKATSNFSAHKAAIKTKTYLTFLAFSSGKKEIVTIVTILKIIKIK